MSESKIEEPQDLPEGVLPLGPPRKRRRLDPGTNGCYKYFLTLTCPIDFTDDQERHIVHWHRANSEKTLLVRELHRDGRPHYHSVIHVLAPKQTASVTRKLEVLYKKMDIEWTHNAVCVKKLTCPIGMFWYIIKDLHGEPPLLIIGWQMSWIKDQCKANVKLTPNKLLSKEVLMLRDSSSVARVIKWAEVSGYPLTDKPSFINVVTAMQSEGYQFEKIKPKWLYVQVMAMCGHMAPARSMWENELFALE